MLPPNKNSTCVGVSLDQVGEKIPADVSRTHASALIQTVGAVAVRITPAARRAVYGNAYRLEKYAVGCAGRHRRNQRTPGNT